MAEQHKSHDVQFDFSKQKRQEFAALNLKM